MFLEAERIENLVARHQLIHIPPFHVFYHGAFEFGPVLAAQGGFFGPGEEIGLFEKPLLAFDGEDTFAIPDRRSEADLGVSGLLADFAQSRRGEVLAVFYAAADGEPVGCVRDAAFVVPDIRIMRAHEEKPILGVEEQNSHGGSGLHGTNFCFRLSCDYHSSNRHGPVKPGHDGEGDSTMRNDEDDDSPAHCGTGKTRLYVDAPMAAGGDVQLDKDQSHYLVNVLRMGQGEHVLIFNGHDGEWAAEIAEASKKAALLRVIERTRAHQPLPDIWLLFAPVKRARLDFIAQKATEMGAAMIQPVITRRTIVSRVKDQRLQANVVEAAEQCGLVALPEVREAEKLDALLDRWSEREGPRRILFCDEAAEPGGSKVALERLAAEGGKGKPYALLIGPEGGFDAEERARLHARKDTVAISLGPRILRADTAAIAALAAVQMILGDW